MKYFNLIKFKNKNLNIMQNTEVIEVVNNNG